jgi:hypothetical protein
MIHITRSTAQRWAQIAGFLYIVSGLLFALASFFPGLIGFINALAVPGSPLPNRITQVYVVVAGGLTAGVGTILYRTATVQTSRDAAAAVRDGLLTWYTIDTLGSLTHGSWQNAASNTVVFLALGLPPFVFLSRAEQPGS